MHTRLPPFQRANNSSDPSRQSALAPLTRCKFVYIDTCVYFCNSGRRMILREEAGTNFVRGTARTVKRGVSKQAMTLNATNKTALSGAEHRRHDVRLPIALPPHQFHCGTDRPNLPTSAGTPFPVALGSSGSHRVAPNRSPLFLFPGVEHIQTHRGFVGFYPTAHSSAPTP